jgi:hypothetical protein
MAAQPAVADILEALTAELHDLVFDYREPAPSHRAADDRIERAEGIAGRIRAAVRGKG